MSRILLFPLVAACGPTRGVGRCESWPQGATLCFLSASAGPQRLEGPPLCDSSWSGSGGKPRVADPPPLTWVHALLGGPEGVRPVSSPSRPRPGWACADTARPAFLLSQKALALRFRRPGQEEVLEPWAG